MSQMQDRTSRTVDGTWQEISGNLTTVNAGDTVDLTVYGSKFSVGQFLDVDDVSLACEPLV